MRMRAVISNDSFVYLFTVCISHGYWQKNLDWGCFVWLYGKVNTGKLWVNNKWLNGQVGWLCGKSGVRGLATNFIPKSVFTNAMVHAGQRLLGRFPVWHLFWTDCAGSEVADTWQMARPDDSTMIDVATMMKAHSCQQCSIAMSELPRIWMMAYY